MMYQMTDGVITRIREHWYEWFVVEVAPGESIPSWYLPISYSQMTRHLTCYLFIVAIPAMIFIILNRVAWGVWSDLIDVAELLKQKYESHESEEKR